MSNLSHCSPHGESAHGLGANQRSTQRHEARHCEHCEHDVLTHIAHTDDCEKFSHFGEHLTVILVSSRALWERDKGWAPQRRATVSREHEKMMV